MGRVTVIFLVVCLIAALLHESEAVRRRRRRFQLRNRQLEPQDGHNFADEKENKGKTRPENDPLSNAKTWVDDHYNDYCCEEN